jgi:hypothetical protein
MQSEIEGGMRLALASGNCAHRSWCAEAGARSSVPPSDGKAGPPAKLLKNR